MALLLAGLLAALLAGFTAWGRRRHQRLLARIEVVTLHGVAAFRLGNERDVWVYLPPGYRERPDERYEVLYLNDGQEREAIGLRETLARLTAAGRMRPIIVVAIPTNDNRLHEYGTAVARNDMGLGGLAPAYTHFVVEELLPLIARTFRARPGAGLSGVSLGGLSAFDIAWNHPEHFAVVGVMSGSFWWRAAEDEQRSDPGRRIAHAMARRAAGAPPLRFWFQAGTRDEVGDRDENGVIDAIQDTVELIDELRGIGCRDEQIAYRQTVGGRHDYETWRRVLPDFLQWAYSPAAGPAKSSSVVRFSPASVITQTR
jgi:enterochelin esterase-like enzyme